MVRVAMVVTNACSPDPRVLRHAVWMKQAGYEVTVHAFDRDETHPLSENISGVRVMRYRMGPVPYGGTLSTYRGIRRFQRKVIQTLRLQPPAMVYCHDADTLRVGVALKAHHGIPFVFDMHDLQHTWARFAAPTSVLRAWVSGRMKQRMLGRAKKAATILTSSAAVGNASAQGFVEWLVAHGLTAHAVENRPLPPFGEAKKEPGNEWTVGYVGRVRDLAAFELLLSAVRHLPTEERPRLRIAGDGVAAAEVRQMIAQAVENGELEAEVSGAYTQEEHAELLDNIDVMFAMYAPQRGNIMQGALPVKMFDAASRGIPSVVNDSCLMADVAEAEGLGQAASWGDVESVAEALLALKDTVVDLTATGEREHARWNDAMKNVLEELQ
ncbi:MAG: glycosyltransferase [Poseidonia sp.]